MTTPASARMAEAPIGVKICGITEPAGFDAVVAASADWIGFNFFPGSPRFVTPAQAAALSARAGGPRRVGLFVDPSEADIATVLDALPLDVLQLYVPPPRAAALRARFGIPVWLPTGVATRADLPDDLPGIDGHLVESKAPASATRPGGNAVRFDWSVTKGWSPKRPWLLAGGLTPDNVAAAIAISGTRAVDVSSGVERERGVKDPALIAAFVARARSIAPGRREAGSAAAG